MVFFALAVEVLWVIAANVALHFDLIPDAIAGATQKAAMNWRRAYSLYPCHVEVFHYTLRIEDDSNMQLDLLVEHASVDVDVLELLNRRFKGKHVRAHGVSYRMVLKVDPDTVVESPKRLAAFPQIEGFASPPLRPRPEDKKPDSTPEEIDAMWKVELLDCEVDIKELWVEEYRYLGPAHARGSFALDPLKKLWVGPASLEIQPGTLSAGPHVLSSNFEGRLELTIHPVDLTTAPGLQAFKTLDMRFHATTELQNLSVSQLYAPDIEVKGGSGSVLCDLETKGGAIVEPTNIKLGIKDIDLARKGYRFRGATEVNVTMKGEQPEVLNTVTGMLSVPAFDQLLDVALSSVNSEVELSTNKLTVGPEFRRLSTHLGAIRIEDVSPLVDALSKKVPVVAPAVLGKGPLTAEAFVTVTDKVVLRLKEAKCGAASARGAVMSKDGGWYGAAAGKFSAVPIGLKFVGDDVKYQALIGDGWLDEETGKLGLTLR